MMAHSNNISILILISAAVCCQIRGGSELLAMTNLPGSNGFDFYYLSALVVSWR